MCAADLTIRPAPDAPLAHRVEDAARRFVAAERALAAHRVSHRVRVVLVDLGERDAVGARALRPPHPFERADVLERHGRSLEGVEDAPDALRDEQPVLASCYGASAADVQLLGNAADSRTDKLVRPVRLVPSPERALVALLGDGAVRVRWILMTPDLRQLVLASGRRLEVSDELMRRVEEATSPRQGSASHRSHLHVRVECPDDDRPRCQG